MFETNALLPMPGRAAMIVTSLGCSPCVNLSYSTNPVGMPDGSPLLACAISATTSGSNSANESNFEGMACWVALLVSWVTSSTKSSMVPRFVLGYVADCLGVFDKISACGIFQDDPGIIFSAFGFHDLGLKVVEIHGAASAVDLIGGD